MDLEYGNVEDVPVHAAGLPGMREALAFARATDAAQQLVADVFDLAFAEGQEAARAQLAVARAVLSVNLARLDAATAAGHVGVA